MEENELVADPHKLFPSNSILVMGPLFSEAEHHVYYSTHRFTVSETDSNVIWISTDTPYQKIKEKFADYGYPLSVQSNSVAEIKEKPKGGVFFIDMISHRAGVSRKQCDDCKYVQDPSNLTELSLVINELLSKESYGLLVLDSLNSLLIYNDLTKTLQFLRFLSATAYEKKITILIYFVSGERDPRAETSIKMTTDVVITFQSDHVILQKGSSEKSYRFQFLDGKLKLFHP